MMMTRTLKWIAALCVAALSTMPALAAGVSPAGSWQVTTGEARYEVTSCGKAGKLLCAKLVWLAPGERTAENLAFLNTYVVKGARPRAGNVWTGNVVFDGHSYDGTMTMVSKNFMTLRGCSGILCQTYEFTRI
jgi:uncharacterized protein (DUF2147 family)